jgi:hypothetical protein
VDGEDDRFFIAPVGCPQRWALLTRNGVSYERALMAIVQAMGDTMPDEFAVDIARFA